MRAVRSVFWDVFFSRAPPPPNKHGGAGGEFAPPCAKKKIRLWSFLEQYPLGKSVHRALAHMLLLMQTHSISTRTTISTTYYSMTPQAETENRDSTTLR
jgi:hypothetical protein